MNHAAHATPSQIPVPPPRFPVETSERLLFHNQTSLREFCTVRLRGRLDHDRLRRAVRLSLDSEPILGCRLVPRFFRPRWERRADLDELDICSLQEVSSEETAQRALLGFMTIWMRADKDPLVRVLVVRQADDILCFKLNHVVGDGAALKAYVGLVAGLYCRIEHDPRHTPAPQLATRRDAGVLFARHSWLAQLALSDSFIRQRRSGSAWDFPEDSGAPAKLCLLSRTLPKERMEFIARYCRELGVTTNEVLIAAMYLAFLHHLPPSGARLLRGGGLLTNVGEIATESVRFGGAEVVEACITSGGMAAYGFQVSSFRGALTLSYLVESAVIDAALAARVLAATCALLPGADTDTPQAAGMGDTRSTLHASCVTDGTRA